MKNFVRKTTEKRVDLLGRHLSLIQGISDQFGFRIVPGKVDGLPPTINHYYGMARGGRKYLTEKATTFRNQVSLSSRAGIDRFPRTGTVLLVVAMYSPRWVKKSNEIEEWDVDNRTKPLLDALKFAYGFKDEIVWGYPVFKIQSSVTETHWWFLELGDIVEVDAPLIGSPR